jgi:hypothetical protein
MKRSASPTKVLETKEQATSSSHSYEHLSSPPGVARQSAAGLSLDRPPMSVVAVRSAPPKAGSSRSFLEPRSAARQAAYYGRDEEEARSVSSTYMKKNVPSRAFRLQPRGKPVCTPSPASSTGSRGRKRSAQCLATEGLATVIGISKDLFPSSSLSNEQSLLGLVASPKKSPPSLVPAVSNHHGSLFSPMESPQETPQFETFLRNLSIQSPKMARRPVESSSRRSPAALRTQTPGSSFKAYHSSSLTTTGYRCYTPQPASAGSTCTGSTPGSKLGSMHSPPSCSTAKSSPRFAPCTVLRGRESGVVASKKMTPTQQQRPPLHHSGPASLLFSLDGTDGDTSDDELLLATPPPRQPPSAVEYHPRRLLSNEETTPRSKEPSPGIDFCPSMIVEQDFSSPPKHGRSYPSPRTPLRTQHHKSPSISGQDYRSPHASSLPKFSLTPKRTPNGTDLLMTGRDGLIFLSPSLHQQSSIVSSSKQMKPDSTSVLLAPRDVAADTQHKWKYYESANKNSLTLSMEGEDTAESPAFEPGTPPPNEGTSDARFLPQRREPSFHIADHDRGDRVRRSSSVPSRINQGGFLGPSSGSRPPPLAPSSNHETTAFSGVTRTTQFCLTPSRSGGLLQAMMEAADEKETALNFDEGDLTDDEDDDVAFILTAPGVLAEEREAQNRESIRARQRPRRVYAEPDQQASNMSLLGMDIIQPPSCSRREVPGFNLASKSEGSSSARLPGNEFLASSECFFPMLGSPSQSSFAAHNIGLALDSAGRDLVTPPPS